jgi:hypothetical protein
MINNTTLQRWTRAQARNLDAQFIAEAIQGLNCSPFEASVLRDKVHEVYAPLMESADALKIGQLRYSLISADEPSHRPLKLAKQCVVVLTFDAGDQDRLIRQREGLIALRRYRFVRICEEAFQQGGLLTLEGIADLFNCSVRTLVTDFAAIRAQGIVPPLRSTVQDMGRAITHRQQIVSLWLAGLEYSEIAEKTYHSIVSVGNYIEKYKRCATLLAAGFDTETTSVVARLSPALVRAYQQLIENAKPVPHRSEELDSLTKKNMHCPRQMAEGAHQ